MTLAVAAICPWRPYPDRYLRMGRKSVEHVILATDSRWSKRVGGRVEPMLDVGRKLYPIGDSMAVVFAGHVESGHDGLGRLKRCYSRASDRSLNSVLGLAEESFAFCYRAHMQNRRGKEPLYYLLAAGWGTGVTLHRFGYDNGFKPIPQSGVQAIGDVDAKEMFYQTLGSGLHKWYEEGKLVDRVTDWAIAVSASLDASAAAAKTVGGKVQLGIVSPDGYWPLRIVSLDVVSPIGVLDVWRDITGVEKLTERPSHVKRV